VANALGVGNKDAVRPVDYYAVYFGSAYSDRLVATVIVSYAIGCAFGRWNLKPSQDQQAIGKNHQGGGVFQAGLPPGHKSSNVRERAESTPFRFSESGILPDDPEHPEDVVHGALNAFEAAWKEEAEPFEKDIYVMLTVESLREYLRKTAKGGFWDDHITRYSKSRRRAPIYWLLQSSKKNYALWLYYHRLDKDLLFKALVNYVEPKIRLETNRLGTIRSQKAAAGESGKESKRLDKEVEQQEDFISELRDFEDKLRRAANLHLQPDLNDGVVLNIAPLHELVPWNEAQSYWEELLKGEYAWSSIGNQLRQKGLVK